MLPIQTPNELLQRSPPPARVSSRETLETLVDCPHRQNTVEDSLHKAAGEDHGVVDESILELQRSMRRPVALWQQAVNTLIEKSVVARSLLEAGAAAEETARVQEVGPRTENGALITSFPCAEGACCGRLRRRRRSPSLPFGALGEGLRPHHQPLCQVSARRRSRVNRAGASRPGQKWTRTAH